jgi:hypothetical protein
MIVRLDEGTCFTYFDFGINRQILLWFDEAGATLRGDTVYVDDILFAYGVGTQSKLVEVDLHDYTGYTLQTFKIHTYNGDGSPPQTETIYSDTLWSGETPAGNIFDYKDGTLVIAAAKFREQQNPPDYRLRVLICQNEVVTATDSWDPGPIPQNSYIAQWAIASASWSTYVLGFFVQMSASAELWYQPIDAEAHPVRTLYTIPVPPNERINGLDLLVENGMVYSLLTSFSPNGLTNGAARIAGFPYSEILGVQEQPALMPQDLSIMGYPNPFNSTVQLEYFLPRHGEAELVLYDLLGRQVTSLFSGVQQSGHGTVTWSADQFPSGLYFARLTNGHQEAVQKLLLLK